MNNGVNANVKHGGIVTKTKANAKVTDDEDDDDEEEDVIIFD